jgi:glucokinase
MSSLDGSREVLVGVDVGGTKVAVLVVDGPGQVLAQTSAPTALNGPDHTISGIITAIEEALAAAAVGPDEVAAIGVGIPGRVDPSTGIVRHAVNLGGHLLPVGEQISAAFGAPCAVENDVRVAAMGIQRHMGQHSPRNMAYVSVGTGIAAGVILEGRLYRGAHGMAGEIGHMVVEPHGPRCQCGSRGCLEALAAGPAIALLGEEAARLHPQSALNERGPVTAESVYRAARDGDAAALQVTHTVGRYLALALQQLIMAYDVERIVLGGGVSRDGDAFLQPILTEIQRMRDESPLAHEMLRPDMISLLPPEFDAGTRGAVALAARSLVSTHPAQPEPQEGGDPPSIVPRLPATGA